MTAIGETRLREMRTSGASLVEIADAFGMTQGTVKKLCDGIGIPSSAPSGEGWQEAARRASDMLLHKLRQFHPEMAGAGS